MASSTCRAWAGRCSRSIAPPARSLRRLGLFGAQLDPTIYVTGPITVSDDGILYYNTLKLPARSRGSAITTARGW